MKFKIANRNEDLFTSSELALGVLAGVALGLAAGILLAPNSGKDTRDKIAGAVNDQAENLSDQWNKTATKAKEAFDSAKAKAGIAVNKAADTADKLSAKAESKADDLADESRSLLDRAKDALKIN
ncbi:YtxH domain-containing protein [Spirosoma soli]|uniref:YtxH domain-containing protein n=1 Tax=Spirosoma soli TaxID=1770529 RepID=A0ABW5M4Z0_9BACT